jgi:TonB family protein
MSLKNRPYWYSAGLHLAIVLIAIILGYSNPKIFNFGTAAQSPQQVQIVNAVLVLPQPSNSKVITPTPPAPSPPTPPVKNPTDKPNPKPSPTPTPPTPKPTPEQVAQDKNAIQIQKQKVVQQKSAQSSIQQQQAIQKLKALGLSNLSQAVNSNQKEAASAAQAAKDLTLEQKYMGLIQQTIRANWINQFPNTPLTTTLKINLDKQGNVLSVSVSQSSGNLAFDRQAVLAVKKSSPLPLPPDAGMAKKFLNLTLPFSNQN